MPRLSPFSRSAPRVWVIATLCALVVVGWIDLGRVRRVEAVSATDPATQPARPPSRGWAKATSG